jgi:hypothetical protein
MPAQYGALKTIATLIRGRAGQALFSTLHPGSSCLGIRTRQGSRLATGGWLMMDSCSEATNEKSAAGSLLRRRF